MAASLKIMKFGFPIRKSSKSLFMKDRLVELSRQQNVTNTFCSFWNDNLRMPFSTFVKNEISIKIFKRMLCASLYTSKNGVSNLQKQIPVSKVEAVENCLKIPDQPENSKILKVAVVGSPNAGKSTLTNALLGTKVSSVSSKVHTTRHKINAILTEQNTQIIFLDTPGIIHPSRVKKHHLQKSLLVDPHESLKEADIIAVVVDVSKSWNRCSLDPLVLQILHVNPKIPSLLILNKVDLVPKKSALLLTTKILTCGIVQGKMDSFNVMNKKRLPSVDTIIQRFQKSSDTTNNSSETLEHSHSAVDLEINNDEKIKQVAEKAALTTDWQNYYQVIRKLSKLLENEIGWRNFDHVFMVSAKETDGVADLKEYLFSSAKPGDWCFHSSMLTDQNPWELAKQAVWEKCLDHLPQEVPYNLDLDIVYWIEDNGYLQIVMDIKCRRQKHVKLCIGKGGEVIRAIKNESKQALMDTFQRELALKLVVLSNEDSKS